jgi:hypothetical protein
MPKHHYVPRMLLRNFTVDIDKNLINIHLLNDDRFLNNKALYGQAQEDNLYGSDQELENFFSKLETIISPCLTKINTKDINLSKEEQCFLKLFLIIQLIRTPGFTAVQKNCIEEMTKRIPSHDKEWKKYLDAYSVILNEPYKSFFSNSRDFYNLISDLRIGLLEADKDKSFFVIGQNPVILLNPFLKEKNHWIWSTQGLALKGLIMVMPISPKFSLILYDNLRYTLLNKNPKWIISSSDVEKLNDFQYCNTAECIYFANSINEEQYKKKNTLYRNYREGGKADFEVIGSTTDEKTGYKTEITKTGIKEFPIEQKFGFLAYKATEYSKQIISYNDAKREHIDNVNLKRKERLNNKQNGMQQF